MVSLPVICDLSRPDPNTPGPNSLYSKPPVLTVHAGGLCSGGPSDLTRSAGAAGCLPGDAPPGLAAVLVQPDDLTGSCCQLT